MLKAADLPRWRNRARFAGVSIAKTFGWPGSKPTVHRRQGLNLLLDPTSLVDRCIIENGSWEPRQFSALLDYTRHCCASEAARCVFLDIGAYFGLYALLMDQSMLFDRVVAFEPDQRNARQLAANLFLNSASCIEVRHEAVSDRSGRTWFTQSEAHPTGNRAGISMADGPGSTRREVPMISIDDAFDFVGWTIIAKIDVEGEEHAVLRGMQKTLARNRAVLQVEAFEHNLTAIHAARDELGLRTVGEISPDIYLTNIPEPI